MIRSKTWCAALLALGIAAACERDSSTGEVAGPAAFAGAEASSRNSDSDRDSDGFSGNARIAIRDDCDPRDPAYDPTGGCSLRRGDVTFAEFLGENDSPLSAAVVGHQAWRNDPSYLKIRPGKRVRVTNEGGRAHTFTRVANFGGGKAGPPGVGLNEGMEMRRSARPRRTFSRVESKKYPGSQPAITASSAASIPGCARSSR